MTVKQRGTQAVTNAVWVKWFRVFTDKRIEIEFAKKNKRSHV